jgi:lipopolysaccharide export LptBFGC system permease protein LptF
MMNTSGFLISFYNGIIYKCKKVIKSIRPTSLDFYIIRQFTASFIVSLFFFVAIYIMAQIFQRSKWVPPGSSDLLLFEYYFYMGVYWMYIFQPFSFLFATVYVLSRMAQFRELTAIISTGISLYRISIYPLLITALYCFVLIVFMQNSLIFPSYQKQDILEQVVFHKEDPKNMERLKDNHDFSVFGSNDLIYIVSYYNAMQREMDNVTIIKLKKGAEDIKISDFTTNTNMWLITNAQELTKERSLIYPEKMNILLRIDCDSAFWDDKNKDWVIRHGIIREIENSGQSFRISAVTNQTYNYIIDPPYYFERAWYDIDAMTYEEGSRYLDKLIKSKLDYKEPEARYLSRFSYPLGMIFIVLAGIGVVDITRRKLSFIINLMLSMGLFVIYYIFYAVGISLAGKGNISPAVGACTGTVFLIISSIYIYAKAKT